MKVLFPLVARSQTYPDYRLTTLGRFQPAAPSPARPCNSADSHQPNCEKPSSKTITSWNSSRLHMRKNTAPGWWLITGAFAHDLGGTLTRGSHGPRTPLSLPLSRHPLPRGRGARRGGVSRPSQPRRAPGSPRCVVLQFGSSSTTRETGGGGAAASTPGSVRRPGRLGGRLTWSSARRAAAGSTAGSLTQSAESAAHLARLRSAGETVHPGEIL